MKRGRAEFLDECNASERPAFESIFDAMSKLSGSLDRIVAAAPTAPGRPRPPLLDFDFKRHEGALVLRHPKLGGRPLTLMMGGSDQTGREEMREAFSVQRSKLVAGGIQRGDVETFLRDLETAGFEEREPGLWRTRTANTPRPDRLSSIFDDLSNVRALVDAVQTLVQAIDRYP